MDPWRRKWPLYQLSHNHCPGNHIWLLILFQWSSSPEVTRASRPWRPWGNRGDRVNIRNTRRRPRSSKSRNRSRSASSVSPTSWTRTSASRMSRLNLEWPHIYTAKSTISAGKRWVRLTRFVIKMINFLLSGTQQLTKDYKHCKLCNIKSYLVSDRNCQIIKWLQYDILHTWNEWKI